MLRIIFLTVLCVYWTNCTNKIWNNVAVDETYDTDAFYEVTLADERQCFGQCAYQEKCFSFEAYRKVPGVVECRLFDFAYIYNDHPLKVKIGAKLYSKPFIPICVWCKNCLDYYKIGHTKNGVYEIELLGTRRKVYCYMEGEGGGWMAFQRRFNGSVSFEDKEWAEYKDGFGNGSGEYWLGLETLHQLTSTQSHDLYARAMDFNGHWENKRFAGFTIAPEEPDKYRFDYQSVYSGSQYSAHALFVNAKGMKFSTISQDNDNSATTSCAPQYPGGWWFNNCHRDYMNGKYSHTEACPRATGLHWYAFQQSDHYKCLKETILMIRPN